MSLRACTLSVCLALVAGAPVVSARRGHRRARPPGGPRDAKEPYPQPKVGDPRAPSRSTTPGVLPPKRGKGRVSGQRELRSLEKDPPDILPLPIDRDRFLWAASPRLRSGAWFSVYGLTGRSLRFRKYEPEIVYDKKDTVLMAEVGGAVRFGHLELSFSLPIVGQVQADFYQKGVVDHDVTKVDRMDLSMTAKLGFSFRRGKSLWLLTPYFTAGLPTGSREQYSTSIGGRQVEHFTAGPKAVAMLPGLAVGWRRGMISAVVSVGVIARVFTAYKLTSEEDRQDVAVSWLGSYQLAFSPWRDFSLLACLTHVHQLLGRSGRSSEDVFLVVPGVRFQPWSGLFGHVGVSIPLGKRSRALVSPVITLSVGWELR